MRYRNHHHHDRKKHSPKIKSPIGWARKTEIRPDISHDTIFFVSIDSRPESSGKANKYYLDSALTATKSIGAYTRAWSRWYTWNVCLVNVMFSFFFAACANEREWYLASRYKSEPDKCRRRRSLSSAVFCAGDRAGAHRWRLTTRRWMLPTLMSTLPVWMNALFEVILIWWFD